MSLFAREQDTLNEQLNAFCEQKGLPRIQFAWNPIPFAGQWGISTSFFQLASQAARLQEGKPNIPALAGQLADEFAAFIGRPRRRQESLAGGLRHKRNHGPGQRLTTEAHNPFDGHDLQAIRSPAAADRPQTTGNHCLQTDMTNKTHTDSAPFEPAAKAENETGTLRFATAPPRSIESQHPD